MTALEAIKQRQVPAPAPSAPTPLTLPDRGWRRWWQIAIAALGLVALLPVSLANAIVNKLSSRGPIL